MAVFDDPNLLSLFHRVVENEERWHTFGLLEGVNAAPVVHAYRAEGDAWGTETV